MEDVPELAHHLADLDKIVDICHRLYTIYTLIARCDTLNYFKSVDLTIMWHLGFRGVICSGFMLNCVCTLDDFYFWYEERSYLRTRCACTIISSRLNWFKLMFYLAVCMLS